jgi:hypothetical protein
VEDRNVKAPVLLFCILLVGVCAVRNLSAETNTPDTELYGPYPTNYEEIVTQWLQTQLIDAESAHIEWNGEPKPANLGTKDKPLYGYLVNFKINARNRFGTYTGMQNHGVLIRDGKVVKGVGFGY